MTSITSFFATPKESLREKEIKEVLKQHSPDNLKVIGIINHCAQAVNFISFDRFDTPWQLECIFSALWRSGLPQEKTIQFYKHVLGMLRTEAFQILDNHLNHERPEFFTETQELARMLWLQDKNIQSRSHSLFYTILLPQLEPKQEKANAERACL